MLTLKEYSELYLLSALQMYKIYIDNLANYFAKNIVITQRLLTEDEIKNCSSYEIRAEYVDSLLESLDSGHKRIVGELFLSERYGGIHDTLFTLGELIDSGSLRLVFNGNPIPKVLCSDGLACDFIGRYHGWDWPNNNDGWCADDTIINKNLEMKNSGESKEISPVALQMYKNYIDNLAIYYSRNSDLARQILLNEDVIYCSSYEFRSEDIDDLVRILHTKHKRVLGHLLLKEKYGGIHDTLLTLDEQIDKGLKLIFNGEHVSTGLLGNGLADDFMKRYLGGDWLDDISQATV
jgi:hypothetical protein